MNIALFGFMGVGKSLVGRIVAERLGMSFFDIDEEIVKRSGRPIPQIFSENGEAAFRELERNVTKDVSKRDDQVIACGGGTVLYEENLGNLRKNSLMILLTADPATIMSRVEANAGSRPLLDTHEMLERINILLSKRQESYMRAADLIIDTIKRSPDAIAEEIIHLWRNGREDNESYHQ